MVKKLKLDKEKIKKFLLEKVEVVGLAGAGLIAFLLLVAGLMAAFGASSPDRELPSATAPDSTLESASSICHGCASTAHWLGPSRPTAVT